MRRWQARGRLVILAAVAIAAGVVVPFVHNAQFARDILAGGLVLGGIAMLVVALVEDRTNGNGDHRK